MTSKDRFDSHDRCGEEEIILSSLAFHTKSLSNNVPLYLYENCAVEFSGNVATGFGGAIYNNGDQDELIQPTSNLNKCSIRFTKDCCNSFNDCVFNTSMFSITFTDNHAQQGGHAVYATPIYNCTYCIF